MALGLLFFAFVGFPFCIFALMFVGSFRSCVSLVSLTFPVGAWGKWYWTDYTLGLFPICVNYISTVCTFFSLVPEPWFCIQLCCVQFEGLNWRGFNVPNRTAWLLNLAGRRVPSCWFGFTPRIDHFKDVTKLKPKHVTRTHVSKAIKVRLNSHGRQPWCSQHLALMIVRVCQKGEYCAWTRVVSDRLTKQRLSMLRVTSGNARNQWLGVCGFKLRRTLQWPCHKFEMGSVWPAGTQHWCGIGLKFDDVIFHHRWKIFGC